MAEGVRYVGSPGIRPGVLEDRLYQEKIVASAIARNTLVVLPTGLGKTAIALRVMAEYLQRSKTGSVLFLAPTRPLVVQHARSITETLEVDPPMVLTGSVSPERRERMGENVPVIVATPQVIRNDLERGLANLARFSLIVFDEAHRAVGEYPYVDIGRANQAGTRARVLAMTASPGSRKERVRTVWANLGIEHFEYRTADDPDVRPYFHGIDVETVEVPLPPEVRHLSIDLRSALQEQTQRLYRAGRLTTPDPSRRELLALRAATQREAAFHRSQGAPSPPALWATITSVAIAMKVGHALELVETQGVEALREYLAKQRKATEGRPTPSGRGFLNDPHVVQAEATLRTATVEHPKLEKTVEIVREQLLRLPTSRVIVFTQYRQTAEQLVSRLAAAPEGAVRAARFVGQASHGGDEGMSQKDQVALLERFRAGEVNCLVATSVAEEGLDVPSTDLVVFYEPLPDVVRTIQRRGRTGRARAGRAVVLVAEGTRDQAIQRGSRSRERRMHDLLETVELESRAGRITAPPPAAVQSRLEEF